MTKAELLELIKSLTDEDEIFIETSNGAVNEYGIEPITISCQDSSIVGYVLAERKEVGKH